MRKEVEKDKTEPPLSNLSREGAPGARPAPHSLGLTPGGHLGETAPLMGQQFNKVIKRRRRRAYLERVKARIKASRSATKKKSSKK